MAKRKIEVPTHRCRDCEHCVPDYASRAIVNGKAEGPPILGGCKYQESKFLINYNYCKYHKLKHLQNGKESR